MLLDRLLEDLDPDDLLPREDDLAELLELERDDPLLTLPLDERPEERLELELDLVLTVAVLFPDDLLELTYSPTYFP